MNTKLDASVVLAVTLGCFAFSVNAGTGLKYTPEYTNDWCTVNSFSAAPTAGAAVADDTAASAVKGGWFSVPADAVTLDSTALAIDTDINEPLIYTNSNVRGVYRITATIDVTLSSELPTTLGDGVKTAICVCTNDLGTATNWWAYIDGRWTNLGGTPETDTRYVIALDSDMANSKIRYLAKKASESVYQELTDGWVANSASSVAITKVSFAGSTKLAGFYGANYSQGFVYGDEIYSSIEEAESAAASDQTKDFVLPVSTGGVVVASAKIPASWINRLISGDSMAEKVGKLDTAGSNGMTYWQSYVLGLEPETSTSKPVVQPVQNANAGNVEFSIGNVTVNNEAGVPVQYRVNYYSNSACPGAGTPGGEFVGADQNATADLPTSEQGVRYYKLEIKFGE